MVWCAVVCVVHCGAAESGIRTVRQLIGKKMTEELILAGAEMLLAKGMRDLKSYSLMVCPRKTMRTPGTARPGRQNLGPDEKVRTFGGPWRLGALTLSVIPLCPNRTRSAVGPWRQRGVLKAKFAHLRPGDRMNPIYV